MDKKKRFKLFDFDRDGKGVEKVDEGPKNFKNFFKFFGRKFYKLLSVNLMMVFLVLPIIVAFFVYIMGPTTEASTSVLYPTAYSASFISQNPATDLLLNVKSFQLSVPIHNSYVYYIIAAIAVVYIVTFGWQNVGSNYLLRGMVRGDAVFIISDYFYAIKKNLKQGFWIGLFDALVIFALVVDFMFFYYQPSSYGMEVMYFVIVALIIIYVMMRPYIYLQMITFDMKFKKILKNALIFTVLGIKRNIMALVGILAIAALNFALIMLLMPLNIILPVILPIFYFIATAGFISTYAAYPIIEKYMIVDDSSSDTDKSEDTVVD